MTFACLRTFVIISLVLHIIALSIAVAFFQPGEERVTRPKPIEVGVISKYKDPGVGEDNPLEPILKEAPELEKSIEAISKIPFGLFRDA